MYQAPEDRSLGPRPEQPRYSYGAPWKEVFLIVAVAFSAGLAFRAVEVSRSVPPFEPRPAWPAPLPQPPRIRHEGGEECD